MPRQLELHGFGGGCRSDEAGAGGCRLARGTIDARFGIPLLAMALKENTQVILPPRYFSPAGFCAAVAQHRVTATWLVPTQIHRLLQYADLESWDLSSLNLSGWSIVDVPCMS